MQPAGNECKIDESIRRDMSRTQLRLDRNSRSVDFDFAGLDRRLERARKALHFLIDLDSSISLWIWNFLRQWKRTALIITMSLGFFFWSSDSRKGERWPFINHLLFLLALKCSHQNDETGVRTGVAMKVKQFSVAMRRMRTLCVLAFADLFTWSSNCKSSQNINR